MKLDFATAHAMANDPACFVKFFWPEMSLYDRQIEILYSIRDNRETHVHAGHKLGKDRTAALAALWFFCTRQPARVIITSSTEKQLRDTLWAEMRQLSNEARANGRPLGLSLSHLMVRKPGDKIGEFAPLDYIVGLVANQGESFHGHHLDSSVKPRVLIILSEASGIDDIFYEAADSQAHRILATGNPVSSEGFFRRTCLSGDAAHPMADHGLLRKIIHIDGAMSPNVVGAKRFFELGGKGPPPTIIPGVLSYEEYLIRLKWPDNQRRTRLHGMFITGADQQLFADDWLQQAQRLGAILRDNPDKRRGGRRAMGVDTAGGGDFTVWSILDKYGVVAKRKKQTKNTAEVCGITLKLFKEFRIRPENTMFDAGGGGREHADLLRDRGYDVQDVNFGEKPNLDEYKNMRAELYGEASKAMTPTGILLKMLETPIDKWHKSWRYMSIPPDDEALRQDLACLPRLYDSEGKLRLPPKDRATGRHKGGGEKTIREMLGRSPDDGDSFVLANYAHSLMREMSSTTERPAAY